MNDFVFGSSIIFGLSITSSWGNGHATTFHALCQALHRRGHRIVFLSAALRGTVSLPPISVIGELRN